MDDADGGCDRCEIDRAKLLSERKVARQQQMGDGPGTARRAKHAMFTMRGSSVVVDRYLVHSHGRHIHGVRV